MSGTPTPVRAPVAVIVSASNMKKGTHIHTHLGVVEVRQVRHRKTFAWLVGAKLGGLHLVACVYTAVGCLGMWMIVCGFYVTFN